MGKGKFSTPHCLQRHRSCSSIHGQEYRPSSEKLLQGNGCFSKIMKISQENKKPIMSSAPGFTRFNTNTNTDQSDSNTTCHDAHIIPAEEYLVNNAPILDNQETTPENSTETTVETPESLKALEA
jgi:hypothetical protein